jgi:hypothetical protein
MEMGSSIRSEGTRSELNRLTIRSCSVSGDAWNSKPDAYSVFDLILLGNRGLRPGFQVFRKLGTNHLRIGT